MKKWLFIILLTPLAIISLPFVGYFIFLWVTWDFSPYFLQADSCLDHGRGCWDKIDNVCRTEEDGQILCDRSKKL